jgi:hypothetical protein
MSKNLNDIVGLTVTGVAGLEFESEAVKIALSNGKTLALYHEQDCCESVRLVDFEDDGIVGGTVLSAEEVVGDAEWVRRFDSNTWTFYKIETTKGGLWMRWLGESNGYYSESVDIWIA